MMAPRPSRRTWWIGIEVLPSTTEMSIETLSSVAKMVLTRLLVDVPCAILFRPGMVTRWLTRATI